jgi:hypothetical protein
MYPAVENDEKTVVFIDLEQCYTAAQALALYTKYYLKIEQSETFNKDVTKILNILTYIVDIS